MSVNFKATAIAFGLATSLFATQASAVVIDWTYNLTTKFTGATTNTGGVTGFFVSPTQLSWGRVGGSITPTGGRSALGITDSNINGLVTTNGDLGLGPTLTHFNNPVPLSSPTLRTASLSSTLTLTPNNPAGPALDPLFADFNINFAETPNVAGTCPVNNGPDCADIFVLTSDPAQFQQQFTYLDQLYTVSILSVSDSLSVLSDAACSAAGVASGCIGFTTQEGKNTSLQFGFVITARPQDVPEPAAIALFGSGLMAMGFGLKRRRKA